MKSDPFLKKLLDVSDRACNSIEVFFRNGRDKMLSYDPNSVSQEKGRLLTERSGGPSPVGLILSPKGFPR
jgi:hypothetical protein